MKYTVRQSRLKIIIGAVTSAMFATLLILVIMLQMGESPEPKRIFLLLLAVCAVIIGLGAVLIYCGIRPRVKVEDRTITYYPLWKKRRVFDITRVKRKATFSRQIGFGEGVAELIFYDGDGELLRFTENMKNADRLDIMLVAEIRGKDEAREAGDQ